jgi:hypothetical protein
MLHRGTPRERENHRSIRGAPSGRRSLEGAPAWGADWSELTIGGASTYGSAWLL